MFTILRIVSRNVFKHSRKTVADVFQTKTTNAMCQTFHTIPDLATLEAYREFWHRNVPWLERSQTSRGAIRWRENVLRSTWNSLQWVAALSCTYMVAIGNRLRALAGIKWSRPLPDQVQFKARKSRARPSLSYIKTKINTEFILNDYMKGHFSVFIRCTGFVLIVNCEIKRSSKPSRT